MEFFEGEHHTGQRQLKAAARPGARAARDEVALFHACPSQQARHALSGDGADLNRWPFAAERQPRTDADSTGQDFHPEDADPAHAHDA